MDYYMAGNTGEDSIENARPRFLAGENGERQIMTVRVQRETMTDKSGLFPRRFTIYDVVAERNGAPRRSGFASERRSTSHVQRAVHTHFQR